METNIILHTTTFCNYNCSYCDVIKNTKKLSKENLESILFFIKNNKNNIGNFKFFWWEPLLAWDNIKNIIDETNSQIWNNYEIVTNTTILTDEIWEYFSKYFKIIFFSIDSENAFDYNRVEKFIIKHNLEEKVYFNLVINPWQEKLSLEQFNRLYDLGFRWFNILPVYFTKSWEKENLEQLSKIMKYVLDLKLKDNSLRLYWFQENLWTGSSLINNTIFIDIDTKVYYSDIVSTSLWQKIKQELFLWNIDEISLKEINNIDFKKEKNAISLLEKNIYNEINWQKQLIKIMDYFSEYLNKRDKN